MHINFTGKTAIVTGAAHGIGRSITHALVSLGAIVWACDIIADKVKETAETASPAGGGHVQPRIVDVTDKIQVTSLVSDAKIEEEKEEVPEDIPHKESDEPAEPEIKAESKEEEKALDQPEWLPDKFWDEKEGMDVESLSKSYQSLEKKLGSQNKAPKEYDLSALKDIPEDDPLRQKYVEWADNNKITQDGFNELAEAFIEMSNAQQEQSQTDIDSERKKLGPNADTLINGSVDWAKSLVDKGIWGEDDFEEYKLFFKKDSDFLLKKEEWFRSYFTFFSL